MVQEHSIATTPPLSPRSVVTSRTDFQIRADFYHKLGLLSPSTSTIESCWSPPCKRSSHPTNSDRQDCKPPECPQRRPSLGRMSSCLRSSSSFSSDGGEQAFKKRVSFGDSVRVVEIESCRDYPRDTWLSLWDEKETVRRERKRNALEFHSDGCDWRGATEEEDFYLAADGKTLVHPATYWSNSRLRPKTGRRRVGRSRGLLLEMEPPCGCVPNRMWGDCECAR